MRYLLGLVVLCRLAVGLRVGEASSFALAQGQGTPPCVEVRRSPQGTCEIVTRCAADTNLSGVEFGFTCLNRTSVQRHSYGLGSFASEEAFDSGVRCERCGNLTGNVTAGRGRDAAHEGADATDGPVADTEVQALERAAGTQYTGPYPEEVALMGPEHCVRAFLSPAGTCVMEMRCEGVDTSDYAPGFTCVHAGGGSTRHAFEPGTLHEVERRDSGVACEACLGLDTRLPGELPLGPSATHPLAKVARVVKELSASIHDITQEYRWLVSNVTRIEAAVTDGTEASVAAVASEAPVGLVRRARRRHRATVAGHRRPRRRHRVLSHGRARHRRTRRLLHRSRWRHRRRSRGDEGELPKGPAGGEEVRGTGE